MCTPQPRLGRSLRWLTGVWRWSALPDSSTLIFLVGLSQFSSSDISISSSRRMPISCSLWAFRSSWKQRTHGRQNCRHVTRLCQRSLGVLRLIRACLHLPNTAPPNPEGSSAGSGVQTDRGIRYLICEKSLLTKGESRALQQGIQSLES